MAWTTLHDLENSASRIQSRFPLAPKVKAVFDDQWASNAIVLPAY